MPTGAIGNGWIVFIITGCYTAITNRISSGLAQLRFISCSRCRSHVGTLLPTVARGPRLVEAPPYRSCTVRHLQLPQPPKQGERDQSIVRFSTAPFCSLRTSQDQSPAWLGGAISYVPAADKNQIWGAGGTCPVYTGCQLILGAPLTCHSGSKPNPGSQKWFSNNRAPRSPLGTYQHAGSQAGESRFNKLPGIPMQGSLGSTDLHGVKCARRHHASQAGLSRSPADTPHATLGIRPCTELPLDP